MPKTVRMLLPFVFFLSGVSALIFETLWFRQTGIAFGNSVWAGAIVLSSFMAGLALGNGLTAHFGHRIRRPIVFYAGLELVIATAGIAIVLLLPRTTAIFAGLIRPFLDAAWVLQPVRFMAAFLLLLFPAVAMGATLPTLVKAVAGGEGDFGRRLGRLYGINTLGAVVGAVTAEAIWIPSFGILGSGGVAAGFNGLAALLALAAASQTVAPRPESLAESRSRLAPSALRLLAAAFLAGGILLGLEVIWFRLLLQFMFPTGEVFAWMLAVVLAGIGLGGLLAALLLRFWPNAHASVTAVAFLSGAVTVGCFSLLPELANRLGIVTSLSPLQNLRFSVPLMFPASVLSGLLFTLLGKRLHRELGSDMRSAGLLALANTAGSMLGPLIAGFVLLPRIGVELSLWVLSAVYGCVALFSLQWGALRHSRVRMLAEGLVAVIFVTSVVGFPFGLTERLYRHILTTRFGPHDTLVSIREGVNETGAYLRSDFLGEPYGYRLVTDGYSMSGTNVWSMRYMALFVYLPFTFHPEPRDALLISYGVGTTAKTLTDNRELEQIDIVDISPDVIELSAAIFSDEESPWRDPRVTVHIEDGRYFLQTTEQRYDLITAEPPPLSAAGVVNLYTREYFKLIYARLRDGGLVSYWLPVNQIELKESKAIVNAFCEIFPDCTLWDSTPGDWILLGTRNLQNRMSEASIRRQWAEPEGQTYLRAVGIEQPEQVAALFLADAPFLKAWSGNVPPVVDNWPSRMPRKFTVWEGSVPAEYAALMDEVSARRLFERSDFIGKMWPASFRKASLPYFAYQRMARNYLIYQKTPLRMGMLHRLLTETSLETLPLWLVGSDEIRVQIARGLVASGRSGSRIDSELAVASLARRDYAEAVDIFDRLPKQKEYSLGSYLGLYALCMDGRVDEARERASGMPASNDSAILSYWRFMQATFGVEPPLVRPF